MVARAESVETRTHSERGTWETGPASEPARAHQCLLMIPGMIKSFPNPQRRNSICVGRNVLLRALCQFVDLTDGVSGRGVAGGRSRSVRFSPQ